MGRPACCAQDGLPANGRRRRRRAPAQHEEEGSDGEEQEEEEEEEPAAAASDSDDGAPAGSRRPRAKKPRTSLAAGKWDGVAAALLPLPLLPLCTWGGLGCGEGVVGLEPHK